MSSSEFPATSAFDSERLRASRERLVGLPPAPDKMPRALFASTEDQITLRRRVISHWRDSIEDALLSIEDGTTRGIEDGVREMEALKDLLDDVVRSANGSQHPDRTSG